MSTYYTLQNANLPPTQTITVPVPDGQVLSSIWAAAGWSVVSSSSDASSSSSAPYGVGDLVVLWRANTSYPAGAKVLLPNGSIGTPVTGFVTGASFDASKWTVVNDVGAGGGGSVTKAAVVATGLGAGDIGAVASKVASINPATTAAAPTVGVLNLYDATSGALAPPLPAASSVAAGVAVGFKKTDATVNTVSPTCATGDHIGSGSGGTSIPLRTQDQITWLSSDGVSVWVKVDGELSLPALDARHATSAIPAPATSQGVNRVGRYDPSLCLYGKTGANSLVSKAGLAKAAAGAGLWTIGVIGDSKSAGLHAGGGAGVVATASWPARLKKLLMQRYGIASGGTGWVTCCQNGGPGNNDPRWANTSWPDPAVGTTPNIFTATATTSGATRTLTVDEAGTSVKAASLLGGGAIGVQVNGATPANGSVTVTNGTYNAGVWTPAASGSANQSVITITGAVAAGQTVVFTTQSASSTYLEAAGSFNTSGLLVQNMGLSGAHTADWTNGLPLNAANAYKSFFFAASVAPCDEYLISLGVNDCRTSPGAVSAATFATNLAAIAAGLPAAAPKTIVVPTPPSTADTTAATWNPFVSAMYDYADTNAARLIDLGDAQGNSWAAANTAGLMFDALHENGQGYGLDAFVIANALAA